MAAGGLATLFKALGTERGITVDDAELEALGLSDDEHTPEVTPPSNILSIPLPGRAAGALEIFSGDDAESTTKFEGVQSDGLMWYPVIREGQWAVRPGTQGQKKKRPLRVVAGHSTNQRKEIGLADIKAAFDDEAIQHVTVPSTHANTVLENQGFIDKLKIVDGQVKDKKTKKDVKVKVLLGGYRITEPDTKGKLERGTIANRSAGLLYDYVNTETGKQYPVALEHVALTNKPWITGMESFGRKLNASDDLQIVGALLSDEAPAEDELLMLSEADEDSTFLAVKGVAWDHETSPSWLQTQVTQILDEARAAKRRKLQSANTNGGMVVSYDDYPPYYRCREAKPGSALITDGYGDDANAWIAGIAVKDGTVELDEFSKWQSVAKVYMPDDREAPPKNKEPLSDEQAPADTSRERDERTPLQLAQEDRRVRARTTLGQNDDINPPRGGGNMAGPSGATLSELSPEMQRLVQEANARAEAAEKQAERLAETVTRLTGTVQGGEVERFLMQLRKDDGEFGLGLSEERGFGGVLVEISRLMLADDGQPAVQAEHFSTDANKGGELTLSESLQRVFRTIAKVTEGKKSLGLLLSESADPEAGEEFEVDEQGQPKLDADGKKIPKAKPEGAGEGGTQAGQPHVPGGKPVRGERDEQQGEQLSTEQKVDKITEVSPEVARLIGRQPGAAAANQNGGGS